MGIPDNLYFFGDLKVPKLKTKSSAKKRISFTATGKPKVGFAFKRHNLRKRPQKMKKHARGTMIIEACDRRMISRLMPYR